MSLAWLPFGRKPVTQFNPYADLTLRALAAALDISLLFMLLSDAFHLISAALYSQIDPQAFVQLKEMGLNRAAFDLAYQYGIFHLWLINMIVQMAILMVLLTLTYTIWRTTPGKWLLGLKIVDAESNAPISTLRYFFRLVCYIPALLPLMMGIFWISFNKKRRGWHDVMARTVVLNTHGNGWYWRHIKNLYRRLRGKHAITPGETADVPTILPEAPISPPEARN